MKTTSKIKMTSNWDKFEDEQNVKYKDNFKHVKDFKKLNWPQKSS